jgi:hypothetical protein
MHDVFMSPTSKIGSRDLAGRSWPHIVGDPASVRWCLGGRSQWQATPAGDARAVDTDRLLGCRQVLDALIPRRRSGRRNGTVDVGRQAHRPEHALTFVGR